jgi:putative SOS response-associated peptidase YedK
MVEWHDRLPVMVKPRDDEGWLSTDPVDDLRALLRAHPAGETQQNVAAPEVNQPHGTPDRLEWP